jgi:hypothetical protein
VKLPPEYVAQIELGRKLDLIRSTLADLDAPDAAPRLNAVVRLREHQREWAELLLQELDAARTEQADLSERLGHYAMNCRSAMGCW